MAHDNMNVLSAWGTALWLSECVRARVMIRGCGAADFVAAVRLQRAPHRVACARIKIYIHG